MNSPITGIHHVTAIASDPQTNVIFYTGLLGLRLVKKTVNFDDPSAYHLYFGDETGTPGSIVTFFYWPGGGARGRVGPSQSTALVFSAPADSLAFWEDRLRRNEVTVERRNRFSEEVLALVDPDGIPIELAAVPKDDRKGWGGAGISAEHALRGLHTAELTLHSAEQTEKLLTGEMGFRLVRREGDRARFEVAGGGSGRYADVIARPLAPLGRDGVGTIHHIAWRVPDDVSELSMQARLEASGFGVSSVRDRVYFRSVYYRELGGILFEIATDTPGFSVDEESGSLGTILKLPKQFEPARAKIEQNLPALRMAQQEPGADPQRALLAEDSAAESKRNN